MCLIALAVAPPGPWLLAMAANRDEFHDRQALPAAWWDGTPQAILAGRDLEAGGTWLGLRRTAGDGLRIAALTNLRPGLMPEVRVSQPDVASPQFLAAPPSRGRLVTDFLSAAKDPADFLEYLEPPAASYAGFNLLTVEMQERGPANAWYLNNVPGSQPRRVEDGLHVLSNATLGVEWPKTRRLRDAMTRVLGEEAERLRGSRANGEDADRRLGEALLETLADRTVAVEADLPQTGLDRNRERLLSAPFIVDEHYGTRCSTVLLVSRGGRVFFAERRFGPAGLRTGDMVERFRLGGSDAPP